MRVACSFTITVTVRASRPSFCASVSVSAPFPLPLPGVTSAHATSARAVHVQLEGIVTANGKRAPAADTDDGSPLIDAVQPGAGAGVGAGSGAGAGVGVGDGSVTGVVPV